MSWLNTSEALRWQTAPNFNLQSIRGFDLSLSSFWYRSNLVLVFCHPQSDSQLKSLCEGLAGLCDGIQAEDGQFVLLLPEGQSRRSEQAWLKDLPFPVLLDRESRVLKRYQTFLSGITEHGLLIIVLDRYGAVFAAYTRPDLKDPLPSLEIAEWLRFIELQCPE